MERTQIENLIKGTFLFQNLDEFIVEQMVSDPRCTFVEYQKNDVIYDKQVYYQSLGVVLSGRIRAEKANHFYLSTLSAGDYFGAAAMFHSGEEYINRLIAITNTCVFFIPQEVLQWIMRRDYRFAERYISYLSQRILYLNQKLDILSAGTAEHKLAKYLLMHGDIAASMTEISDQLCIGRASLYRAIANLEGEGLIQQDHKRIIISDQQSLYAYCKGEAL